MELNKIIQLKQMPQFVKVMIKKIYLGNVKLLNI